MCRPESVRRWMLRWSTKGGITAMGTVWLRHGGWRVAPESPVGCRALGAPFSSARANHKIAAGRSRSASASAISSVGPVYPARLPIGSVVDACKGPGDDRVLAGLVSGCAG